MTDVIKQITASRARRSGAATRIALTAPEGGRGSLTVRDVFAGARLVLIDMHNAQGVSLALPKMLGTWGLLHVNTGAGTYCANRKKVSIAQGDVIVTGGFDGTQKALLEQNRFRALVLVISEKNIPADVLGVMRSLFDIVPSALYANLSCGHLVYKPAANLDATHVFSELYSTFTHAEITYVRLKCLELLMLYAHAPAEQDQNEQAMRNGATIGDKHMAIAYQAQAAMTADIAHTPTIASLAELCHTSPTVLKESFRETFGLPVYSWFKQYRVHRACELMEEDRTRSIASIAAEVGYSNPSKFAKAFADCMGTTPYRWRQAH